VVQKLVLAYFHFSPLHAPGAPVISFGSAMHPAGRPELSQRFGSAAKGNSARARTASKAQMAQIPASSLDDRMQSPPRRAA
jgi:hypothetical protein